MSENKQLKLADFRYVDFWYTDVNGKNHDWTRIEVGEVGKYQQEHASNFNCFCTVQRYANSKREKGEPYAAPLFFDLDYKPDPQVAKDEAVRIVDFFLHEMEIKESDIWVYFSGSKGFHILIANQAIGIEPRNDLHKIFNHIANYLKYRLGDRVEEPGPDGEPREKIIPLKSIDPAVYTSARMLRLPNSIHQNTRLFKIELTIEELRVLTLDQIKELAKAPRKDVGLSSEERKKALKLRKPAFTFYMDKLKEYEQAEATASSRYSNEVYYFDKNNPPVCVLDILKGGWKKDGDRNQATVQLACYYKDAGYSKEETTTILTDWVLKHTTATTAYSTQQRVANTRSVIDAVYGQDNAYRFGCAFIRSLHGPKQPGSDEYDRVACTYELCPCLKKNNETGEEAIDLHLANTGKAEYTGKLVRTRVMVAGKKQTPYIVPKKIEYSCWGKKGCKKAHCPLYNIENGTIYKSLNVQNRELLQMCGVGDDNIKGILRQISTIPACQRFDMETVESVNLDELLVIPMAENDDVKTIDDKAVNEGRYVLRRIYSVGGLHIEENKYYEIEGYVFPHPKNQEGTIIVKTAKPLQDVVERFKLTDEIKESLKIFQPHDHTPEAIYEKLQTILDDLTYNVTHIVERDEVLLGVLLTYHSVLRFSVPWDSQHIRGWVELKILGDTATGKSALVEKVQKYIGLGTRVNAESTSRTGLTYKMEQSGTGGGAWYIVWGAWPLADRELIWIDEDTGITKEEYGEMTLARSDGKLEVKRAVTAETPCRVRAILSGNVPRGKRLSDYTQGVEALKDIFNNEDIRRFDFAVFMRYSDVDPSLYNQKLQTYPVQITAELLKNNVLFAWSRRPDDVIITADAQDAILEGATELSRIYGNASDIPLVTPSDQRNKIARLSVALAALLHSTDESGERIQVWPGHVEFIISYLKGIYNAGGCGLNYYAKLCVREEDLDDDKYSKLTEKLKSVDTLKGEIKFAEFLNLFARTKYLRQSDLEAMLAIGRDEAKDIATVLTRLKMVEVTTGGYRKTARFNAYIAKAFELGLFDNYEDDV